MACSLFVARQGLSAWREFVGYILQGREELSEVLKIQLIRDAPGIFFIPGPSSYFWICNELCGSENPQGQKTQQNSAHSFLLNFLTLDLFSHCHLFPVLLLFPSMDSSVLDPSPEGLILSHWVSFSLSLSIKMTILEYLVAFVVPWGKILPLQLL